MKVSLRKASALEAALRETAKGIALNKTISVSVYSDVSELSGTVNTQIEEAREALKTGIADITALLKAAYHIRADIAAMNADKSGVDGYLNERALIEALDRAFAPLTAKERGSEGIAPEHVSEALKAQRARNEKSDYGTTDHVTVNVVGDITSEVKAEAQERTRRKVALADLLLSANVSTTYDLDDEVVAVLERFNLV